MRWEDASAIVESPRFRRKVDRSGECWLWTGAKSNGYGKIGVGGGSKESVYAHRIVLSATLRVDLEFSDKTDHLCRNPSCVNPLHLELVTNRENTYRGLAVALKETCANGHPWIEDNWYINPSSGARSCQICRDARAGRKRSS